MRALLLMPFLLISVSPLKNVAGPNDNSPLAVLTYKWSKSRQVVEVLEAPSTGPAPAMTAADKNFARSRRVNDPAGVRDPNADTLDARSAAMEKNVQESRTPKPKAVDGFAYRVKVQNSSSKVVEVVFWEYQFTESSNPANVVRRQFLCGVNIKPDKEKELQAFSLSGPSDVISVGSLASKSENLFQEKVLINRVEYSDGSIWQRKDWNFAEVRLGVARATGTPWGTEMCRGL
jgi:hypothetical protein